jgi:hypothetical protein
MNAQIALSLVMGKLVELTGLTHYYIIVACLGTGQHPVFYLRNIKCFGSGFISCGSLSTLLADSENCLCFFTRFLTKIKVFFTGLERLLTFL